MCGSAELSKLLGRDETLYTVCVGLRSGRKFGGKMRHCILYVWVCGVVESSGERGDTAPEADFGTGRRS